MVLFTVVFVENAGALFPCPKASPKRRKNRNGLRLACRMYIVTVIRDGTMSGVIGKARRFGRRSKPFQQRLRRKFAGAEGAQGRVCKKILRFGAAAGGGTMSICAVRDKSGLGHSPPGPNKAMAPLFKFPFLGRLAGRQWIDATPSSCPGFGLCVRCLRIALSK